MDISTFVEKIRSAEIDLQPDFQRGQVWPEPKKKRLIDTILRGWYVPAIHLVINDDLDREEVLDGQQRLQAILEFVDDKLKVDGSIEPFDAAINALNNLTYSKLPASIRSRFRRFPITTVRLRDYEPEEPGELFFRLNQLTALTAAEQRNALIGEPRNQIRKLAELLEDNFSPRVIGFSNARMNYDDVLSRLAFVLEHRTLTAKVTSTTLERRYRDAEGFPERIMREISECIETLSHMMVSTHSWKQNKATLFSWLFFLADNRWTRLPAHLKVIAAFFEVFESARAMTPYSVAKALRKIPKGVLVRAIEKDRGFSEAIRTFADRASSRVNDVTSLLLRDAALHVCFSRSLRAELRRLKGYEFDLEVTDAVARAFAQLPDELAERAVIEGQIAQNWAEIRAARKAQ